MMKESLKSGAINLLILVMTFAMLLVIAEISLRFLGMADPVTYITDPVTGYEPRPNQSSVRLGTPIFINDVGLRDNENYSGLDSKEIILVVGDSVTYGGSRMNQEDLFTESLERKLRVHKPKAKVFNAGVNGYSISQMVNRAGKLMQKIDPKYLILYASGADFFRPPVVFLTEENYVYPQNKPELALKDFLLLSVNHLNVRYKFFEWLPDSLVRIWKVEKPTVVPDYDKSKIVEIHFATIEKFVQNSWESSGRKRENICVFFSPSRASVLNNLADENRDLLSKFKSLNLKAYDLQKDFYTEIISKGEDVNSYYWDQGHYIEKGHSLAADLIYQNIIEEGFFDVQNFLN